MSLTVTGERILAGIKTAQAEGITSSLPTPLPQMSHGAWLAATLGTAAIPTIVGSLLGGVYARKGHTGEGLGYGALTGLGTGIGMNVGRDVGAMGAGLGGMLGGGAVGLAGGLSVGEPNYGALRGMATGGSLGALGGAAAGYGLGGIGSYKLIRKLLQLSGKSPWNDNEKYAQVASTLHKVLRNVGGPAATTVLTAAPPIAAMAGSLSGGSTLRQAGRAGVDDMVDSGNELYHNAKSLVNSGINSIRGIGGGLGSMAGGGSFRQGWKGANEAYWLGAIEACVKRGYNPADVFKVAQAIPQPPPMSQPRMPPNPLAAVKPPVPQQSKVPQVPQSTNQPPWLSQPSMPQV